MVGKCINLFALWLPKTNLVGKFPCLLKLLSTNLEWSASFFELFLPFAHGQACEPTTLQKVDHGNSQLP